MAIKQNRPSGRARRILRKPSKERLVNKVSPPVIDAVHVPERIGSRYPSPFDSPCAARSNRALGDVFGLTRFGVNLLTLALGVWSSQRHWHTLEDELVYVLEGNPSLIDDSGEILLTPGKVVGFPAGVGNSHHIVNNGSVPARLIVIGSRDPDDDVFYGDIDMQILKRAEGGAFTRRSGESY
jgi:uncharacterized cupin superfamily protein